MTNTEQMKNLLGLAQRAGKLETGTDFTLKAVAAKKAKLVILATDASSNLTKKIQDKCNFYDVPLAVPMTVDDLSIAIGHVRSVVAVMDAGFAKSLAKLQPSE
ncbi:YlxQ-related RNA-binding protein [Lacticaseibacillus pabuli]|uniref:YlxQ-related RNA-binding protein n=1 Tax=Lacticaseibacillus pabuli TaxID=3025672 RepID=A0ABY7WUA6_9LACO|nr:YlxQ-related RNA-binding protein [Lacticaseibacillus sp. KACC 23028]WDF83743.1 YlxQ-related RNA-binding protein [Lacticaseibacillus sp. KACC 23028]